MPDEPDLEYYKIPYWTTDLWNNIHLTGIGFPTGNPPDDYEAYYSFYNAPPLAPLNIATLTYPTHPKFKWSPGTEPNITNYKIFKSLGYPYNWQVRASTTDTIFIDDQVVLDPRNPTIVYYHVKANDEDNQLSVASDIVWFRCNTLIGGKVGANAGVLKPIIADAYPNPFNSNLYLHINLPYSTNLNICIYDVLGNRVRNIADGNYIPGSYGFVWDGINTNNESVASGIYYYQITTDCSSETKMVTLIK